MSYPNSSDVASGQPTAAAHYNNLRKDSVFLGNESADSVNLGAFLQSFVLNMRIEYLATDRLRIPYDSQKPACVMISGCMLVQTANVDLAAGAFSGVAATWYIFAVRAAGVTSFTLAVNSSPSPAADQRLIGEVYWDGTHLAAYTIYSYPEGGDILAPDYDSGWFAVAYNNVYNKAHGLGAYPRLVLVVWGIITDFFQYWHVVRTVGHSSGTYSGISFDFYNVVCKTGGTAASGCLMNVGTVSGAGNYRVFAWR